MHLPSVPDATADGEDEEENDLGQDSLDTFLKTLIKSSTPKRGPGRRQVPR